MYRDLTSLPVVALRSSLSVLSYSVIYYFILYYNLLYAIVVFSHIPTRSNIYDFNQFRIAIFDMIDTIVCND